jgi:hypothetical protein
MELLILGSLLTLVGIVVERLVDLVRGRREISAKQAARRWDVEYDSLKELGDLLPTFTGMQSADLEARKVRAVALAWRVRDERASKAVELLIVQPAGSQSWNDEIGNATRAVGQAMREL